MKKQLIFAAFCSVALLFASCGPEQESEIQGLSVKPESIELAEGATQRLSVAFTPENLKQTPEIEWTTSDSTVATVSGNGTVTAIAKGNAVITAKTIGIENEFQASCKVTVKDYYETVIFTGAYLGIMDTVGDLVDTVKSSAGDTYLCKRIPIMITIFSDGFYVSESNELAGTSTGSTIAFNSTMYYAPNWANHTEKGTYFALGDYYITPKIDEYPNQPLLARPYEIDVPTYMANMQDFIANFNAGDQQTAYQVNLKAAAECITDPYITTYDYHTTAEGYGQDGYYSSVIPSLLINYGRIEIGNNFSGSNVMLSVEAHEIDADELRFETGAELVDQYVYGVKCTLDENTGYSIVDMNKIYVNENVYSFKNGKFSRDTEAAEAPAKRYMIGNKTLTPITNLEFDPAKTAAIHKLLHNCPQVVK